MGHYVGSLGGWRYEREASLVRGGGLAGEQLLVRETVLVQ